MRSGAEAEAPRSNLTAPARLPTVSLGMHQRRRDGGGWGWSSRSLLCLCFVAGLLANRPALADDAAAKQVEKLAAEAIQAYRAADYTRTVELLERAYQIRQVAALLYNLAKAYEKLGDQEKAVELYRRYSDSTDAEPKLRVKAEARVAAYEEAHRGRKDPRNDGELHPRLDATPDPIPTPRPVPVSGTVSGTSAAPAPAEAPALRAWKSRRARDRIVGISLGSLGLGAALAGMGLSVHAYSLHQDFAASVGLEADRRALRDRSRGEAIGSDVLYGVAAASAAVGVYFLWRGYHAEKAPGAQVRLIAPFASPAGGGVVLGGSF